MEETSSSYSAMKKWIALLVSIVIVVIIVLWWLARPRGDIQLHIKDTLESEAETIVRELDYAIADTQRFVAAAIPLQFVIRRKQIRNPVPGAGMERVLQFGDLLSFNEIRLKYESEYATFDVEFHPDRIAELLYGKFGFFDYHLVVRDFKEIGSEESGRQLRGLFRLYPLDSHGIAVPTTGGVSESIFRERLAKFLIDTMEGALSGRDCERSLCMSELSNNLISLEATVDAFEFLFGERADLRCDPSDSEEECSTNKTVDKFKEAHQLDPENNFALLGLGLAQLRKAQMGILKASAVDVGRLLMDGFANISSAKQHSPYIGHLMSSEEWAELMKQTPGFSDFPVAPQFIDRAGAYREARRAFVAWDFKNVFNALSKFIDDAPSAIEPHLRNFELYARLFAAGSVEEADPLLLEFEKLRQGDSDFTWYSTYGLVLCRWNNGSAQRIDKALGMLKKAIDLSPDSVTLLDHKAQKGMCLAMAGDVDGAKSLLNDTVKALPPSGPLTEEYQRVYYNLGIGFSLADDSERAGIYLGHAVALNSVYLDGISRQDLLQSFRRWDGYGDWRSKRLDIHSPASSQDQDSDSS